MYKPARFQKPARFNFGFYLILIPKDVLLPFGDNLRYDIVVEENNGKFKRNSM
jgi:hypothetical protein